MKALAIVLIISLSGISSSDGAKILMIPFFNASHFIQLDGVGRPLLDRGHEVYVLLDQHLTLKNSRYQLVKYKSANSGYSAPMSQETQFKIIESNGIIDSTRVQTLIKDVCTDLLSDPEIFRTLTNLKLDLVLVDNFFAKCFYLVPHKLGVPFITVGAIAMPWQMRLPFIPSVVEPLVGPEIIGLWFCEETPGQSSFVRRFCRIVGQVGFESFLNIFEEDYMHKYVDFKSMTEIRENASFHIINQTPLLSSPLPKLPHVEYVGGLSTSPAKPLPKELEKWMSQSANVIVVSFGSRFSSLPKPIAEKLMNGMSQIKTYRFIFRFQKIESNKDVVIPENVRVSDWLPQNDLLGHNSTKAFITHSGYNGLTEAVYHGVPLLCFYIGGDQKANAQKATKRGYGLMMNLQEFTADELVKTLTELTGNPIYSNSIKKASKAFHSEKHPSERAADAVEHVLKFGSEHLRPKEAYTLRIWEYYMLDILVILYLTLVVSIFLVYKIVKIVACKLLCRTKREPKTKAD